MTLITIGYGTLTCIAAGGRSRVARSEPARHDFAPGRDHVSVSAGDVVRTPGRRALRSRSGRTSWRSTTPRFRWRCWSCCRITVSCCWTRSCDFWRTCCWPPCSFSARSKSGVWKFFRAPRRPFHQALLLGRRVSVLVLFALLRGRVQKRAHAHGLPPAGSGGLIDHLKTPVRDERGVSRHRRARSSANSWEPNAIRHRRSRACSSSTCAARSWSRNCRASSMPAA